MLFEKIKKNMRNSNKIYGISMILYEKVINYKVVDLFDIYNFNIVSLHLTSLVKVMNFII